MADCSPVIRVTPIVLALAAALLLVAGCGGDDSSDGGGDQPPAATSPQESGDSGTAPEGEDRATAPRAERVEPSSPADRALGSELGDRLAESAVTAVEVGRTSVVVRTKLDAGSSKAASGICAKTRLLLAQEPSRTAADTITIVGGDRRVLTRC